MRNLALAIALGAVVLSGCTNVEEEPQTETASATDTERNKEIARKFYEDLWFSNNTGAYADYVADEYVVHDIGERKGITEEASAQKGIADFFHSMGEMTGEIDYQIAEGDKVATRWFLTMTPSDFARERGMEDVDRVAIINVMRFNDEGKIVEFWNHRHDVELPQPRNDDGSLYRGTDDQADAPTEAAAS